MAVLRAVRHLLAGSGAAVVLAAGVAAAPVVPLDEVVVLPDRYEAQPLPSNAAWLDEVDPALRAWVVETAAVRPPGLPQRGGGVVLVHGVRFDTATHARQAWEAIRAAEGQRFEVEGFADVHGLRDPLIAGAALVDYHRLVGRDVVVLQLRVDGGALVSDEAQDLLAWHVRHTDGGAGGRAAGIVAVLVAVVVLAVLRRRRRSAG